MAKTAKNIRPQNYPRIEDESDQLYGFLDESKLQPHVGKIPREQLRQIVLHAIEYANVKSSRAILNIPEGVAQVESVRIYRREGLKLFGSSLNYLQRTKAAMNLGVMRFRLTLCSHIAM